MAGRPASGPSSSPVAGDPVIERAFTLLSGFDPTHRSLSLSELARRSGLPTSSALRLARQLVAQRVLERRGRDYVIGLRLWELASLAPRSQGLREAAMPVMGDLAVATGQHVLLAVREGSEAVLVERLSGRSAMTVLYRVGGRLPLHSTGVGLVLLAHADRDFQEEFLGRPLVHEPERIPVDPAALRRRLADVRRDGGATVHRDVPEPLVTVAAPVRGDHDEVVAAVSVVIPAGAVDPQRVGPAVRAGARAISRALGAPSALATPNLRGSGEAPSTG
jgi:DNA-binding IclR family transcriptional regulator